MGASVRTSLALALHWSFLRSSALGKTAPIWENRTKLATERRPLKAITAASRSLLKAARLMVSRKIL
jgi:hypothetical protein